MSLGRPGKAISMIGCNSDAKTGAYTCTSSQGKQKTRHIRRFKASTQYTVNQTFISSLVYGLEVDIIYKNKSLHAIFGTDGGSSTH